MKKFLLILLAVLGVLAVLFGIAALTIGGLAAASKGSVGSKTVLEVDLEAGFEEFVPEDAFSQAFGGKTMNVLEFVQALERAAKDDRVAGLVARVGAAPMGMARIEEVRDAVIAFRKSGKPAIAWAETMGEFGQGTGAYYTATAFDEIYLQPSGDIGLTGMMYETLFLKGMFDKLGVVPRMDHRYEYKNAMNTFTETKFTGPHREALDKVMQSQFAAVVSEIARARKLPEAQVRALFDKGPQLGREALDAKLVDGIAYRDEVYDKLRKRFGSDASFLYVQKYWERSGSPYKSGPVVALIYGVGGVQRGEGGSSPLSGPTMGSDRVAAAFRAATADSSVKAILFRVDSPGGSYVASDTILREVKMAQKAGKPVIVSMGDLAGSGGYFVAMSADRIVAQPGTITASIGVLGGKLLTEKFWEKTGISWDDVHTGAASTMWTGTKDYTPEQWARFQAWLDRVYDDFTTKVSEGRKLPKERVLQIAKGRIWSGADAKGIGLVDELGGFPVALAAAKKAAGLAAERDITLRTFPRKKTLWETILDRGPENSEKPAEAALIREIVTMVRPMVRAAQAMGLVGPEPGVLSMPPVEPAR